VTPRPLRSLTVEHREFCRLVMGPRWRHRKLSLPELDAHRRVAAWRTIRAAMRTNPLQSVVAFTDELTSMWARYAHLPNCPPPFAFDRLDALRMVLDVHSWQAVRA
jgi:hypothetical protein